MSVSNVSSVHVKTCQRSTYISNVSNCVTSCQWSMSVSNHVSSCQNLPSLKPVRFVSVSTIFCTCDKWCPVWRCQLMMCSFATPPCRTIAGFFPNGAGHICIGCGERNHSLICRGSKGYAPHQKSISFYISYHIFWLWKETKENSKWCPIPRHNLI